VISVAIDDLVNKISKPFSGVLGKEGPVQETGRMMLGGLAGVAAPIVLGASGTLIPQVAMNPLAWFYTGGLGFTASGVYQLDSFIGKMSMTIPAVSYFLPKTIETMSYGMATTFPYASSVLETIGAGMNSVLEYAGSALSYSGGYLGIAMPYIGVGLAAVVILYAGYKIVGGWFNKLIGRKTYNSKKETNYNREK